MRAVPSVILVSHQRAAALAALAVEHARRALPGAHVIVLDLDGTFPLADGCTVLAPTDVGIDQRHLHLAALTSGPAVLARRTYPALLEHVAPTKGPVIALRPGALLVGRPAALVDDLTQPVLCSRVPDVTGDDLWPQVHDAARRGAYSAALLAAPDTSSLLALWKACVARPLWLPTDSDEADDARWLDVAAARVSHQTLGVQEGLVSAWSLTSDQALTVDEHGITVDGRQVVGIDLTAFDHHLPWLLDSVPHGNPRGRLSEHPALAGVVARAASRLVELHEMRPTPTWDMTVLATGDEVDPALRIVYRDACLAHDRGAPAPPDPFCEEAAQDVADWLLEPGPAGEPARYVAAIYAGRQDLQDRFPGVPGEHTDALMRWVADHGRSEAAYSAALLDGALDRHSRAPGATPSPSARTGPSTRGVNVIGFLRGELGVGESARQMLNALQSAAVPTRTVPVARHASSRQGASYASGDAGPTRDTSLICVNADLTPSVAASMPSLFSQTYRIGMWYWEVEEFPADQHVGFDHLDEVWVATEFIRRAIEPHSPVPVRTVLPPLPQRGEDPVLSREDLGLPAGPLFLFSFDYLSTVERKNPLGLIDAFERAFGVDGEPHLVIKSINADRRPAEAERLRLRAAASPRVVLLEDYLDAAARDALVAHCDAYVSLHRAEGLGLTIAEAMAWGKPVIATAYSGNLDFMSESNSYLVPFADAAIPEDAAPYPPGGVWAEPDLDAAAAAMKDVIEHPSNALKKGAQAAQDIAALHSPEAAGRRVLEALALSAPHRRARRRTVRAAALTDVVRRAVRRLPLGRA
ncbi:glycosyltransferase [Actinotalea sp. C106]|uniref:glycosyltransferase n=1 Tax=Actinotalea sp. C106 TaxID=2908644 RepID=UPI0020294634|nr:glycosyltransferase [Actinotalea sp. C106]